MDLCTVISHLISDLSSLTTKHMVFFSPMALDMEWICISWDRLVSYPEWVPHEFNPRSIIYLLTKHVSGACRCSTWSKWLPRGFSASLGPKAEPVVAYPLLLWRCLSQTSCFGVKKKKQVHNETFMRTHFRLRDTTSGNMRQISVFKHLRCWRTWCTVLNFTCLCCLAHTQVCVYVASVHVTYVGYVCKRTSHLCVKWKMWM